MKRIWRLCWLVLLIMSACKKQDAFLDEKYNLSDVIPKNLEDFQGLLDNDGVMNSNYPALSLVGSDQYFITDADLTAQLPVERNAYLWAKDIYEGGAASDWSDMYTVVMYANVVLEGLKQHEGVQDSPQYQHIKGSALFFRAFAWYGLVQGFARPYSPSAGLDAGIPLRTSPDVNARFGRGTVQQTYMKMIADLEQAATLLPATGTKITRPSQGSARALLAKIYLIMGDYPKAQLNAEAALTIKNELVDFKTLSPSTFPFAAMVFTNKEYLLYATTTDYRIFSAFRVAQVDSFLYNAYGPGDLRKSIFYRLNGTRVYFRGSYAAGHLFSGLATNELYLVCAEAQARQGRVAEAMATLNALLIKRYDNSFVPMQAVSKEQTITLILSERRKELPFTGQIRWEDLRRLNLEASYAHSIHRRHMGNVLTLEPGNPRYVLPIPDSEVRLSGIEQNPR